MVESVEIQKVLDSSSYHTSPTTSELLLEMTQNALEEYNKAKEEGEQRVIELQQLIQSRAEKAMQEIAAKWRSEMNQREEEICKLVDQIQEGLSSSEGLEGELRQFTIGMRDMVSLFQHK